MDISSCKYPGDPIGEASRKISVAVHIASPWGACASARAVSMSASVEGSVYRRRRKCYTKVQFETTYGSLPGHMKWTESGPDLIDKACQTDSTDVHAERTNVENSTTFPPASWQPPGQALTNPTSPCAPRGKEDHILPWATELVYKLHQQLMFYQQLIEHRLSTTIQPPPGLGHEVPSSLLRSKTLESAATDSGQRSGIQALPTANVLGQSNFDCGPSQSQSDVGHRSAPSTAAPAYLAEGASPRKAPADFGSMDLKRFEQPLYVCPSGYGLEAEAMSYSSEALANQPSCDPLRWSQSAQPSSAEPSVYSQQQSLRAWCFENKLWEFDVTDGTRLDWKSIVKDLRYEGTNQSVTDGKMKHVKFKMLREVDQNYLEENIAQPWKDALEFETTDVDEGGSATTRYYYLRYDHGIGWNTTLRPTR